ncbi:MAG: hypothetical protein H6581_19035 [Bacteroidia bacterium]|nr:hypothetical protein [Bacteroidia bacterium]
MKKILQFLWGAKKENVEAKVPRVEERVKNYPSGHRKPDRCLSPAGT